MIEWREMGSLNWKQRQTWRFGIHFTFQLSKHLGESLFTINFILVMTVRRQREDLMGYLDLDVKLGSFYLLPPRN